MSIFGSKCFPEGPLFLVFLMKCWSGLVPQTQHQNTQNSGIFSTLFFQVYTSIFNHILQYWDILGHTDTVLRHIQAYVGIFSTLCNPCRVEKGVIPPFSRSTPSFLRFPSPFLEIQDVPPFIGLPGKQKYWITLVTNLYVISTFKVS